MRRVPTNEMWCGRQVPVNNGKTIWEFFKTHEGGDIVLISELAKKRFKLNKADYEWWLGEWRFAR